MSSDLLNSILESAPAVNGSSRLTVLAEQHDRSKIQVDLDAALAGRIAGITSQGRGDRGGWDAAEYGISAAEVQRRVALATTPQAKAALLKELVERANGRANLGMAGGKVDAVFAGVAAWHALGTTVSGTLTTSEVVDHCLNWEMAKVRNSYQVRKTVNGAEVVEWREGRNYAVVRLDTGEQLGSNAVGEVYQVIQHKEVLAFLDGIVGPGGCRIESAGSLNGGQKIWVLIHMPQHAFSIDGSTIEPYILFVNPTDGSGQAQAFATTKRAECENTVRLAVNDRGTKGISIRHTGDISRKLEVARQALGLTVDRIGGYRESLEAMSKTPANPRHYANDVLDAVLDVTEAQAKMGADVLAAALEKTEANRVLAEKSFARKIEARSGILDDILERYESDRCHPKGTALAAFDAVTEHFDHGVKVVNRGTVETRAARRFESAVYGDRDDAKQVAFEKAVALAV